MKSHSKPIWFVYIVETDRCTFYTGSTTDVERRLEEHRQGKGAKYFRMCSPKRLVYVEKQKSKGHALRRELEIKNLTSLQKQMLWQNDAARKQKHVKHRKP